MENTSTARTDFAAIAEECEQDFTRKIEATEESFLRDSRFYFLCNADGETPFRTNRNEKGLYDLILDTKDGANPVLARNLSPASAFACMAVAAYFIERETTDEPAAPEKTEDGRTFAQVLEELREVKEERDKLREALKSIREKVSTIESKLREAKFDAERAGSAAEDAKSDADDAEDAANDAASEAEDALKKSEEIREELTALSF